MSLTDNKNNLMNVISSLETKAAGVFDAGKQAQEDAFWDAYQQNGTRVNYAGGFGGVGWTNDNFKPKYDMKPTNAMYMFRITGISGDLVEILENLGVTLDFSECTNGTELFSNASNITRVGVIDVRKMGNNIGNMFAYCGAKTIDKVIVTETQQMLYFPGVMYSLENITFEGTIGQSGMNLQYSTKLSQDSIRSIINALSTTTSGLSITLSRTAVENAWEYGTGDPDWFSLLSDRENWTVNLV